MTPYEKCQKCVEAVQKESLPYCIDDKITKSSIRMHQFVRSCIEPEKMKLFHGQGHPRFTG